jgi:drug/metabolite transporter (DMT)-like permease
MSSAPLVSTIFGLSAAVSWGVADYLGAQASKRTGPVAAAFWASLISTTIYGAIYLGNPGGRAWDSTGMLYAAAAGICLELGLYSFYRGLATGPVSIVSPISSAYPLVSAAAVLILFHAHLSSHDLFGIIVIVIGILAASGVVGSRKSKQGLAPGVLYGLLALLLWGIAYALLGQAISRIGWEKSMLIDMGSGFVALILVLALTARRTFRTSLHLRFMRDKFIVGAAFVQLLGGVIFAIGLQHARSSAVITAISATYPALTIFLALRYLDEKKRVVSIAGAAVTIIGVILLTV